MQTTIDVAIVSEDRLLREALADSLAGRRGLRVVAGETPEERQANVVLIDAGSDPRWGLAQTWEARDRWAGAKPVVLGLDREDEVLVDFIEAGALGYVLRGASPEGLAEAIRAVHDGRTPCSPRVVSRVLARIETLSHVREVRVPEAEPLTAREREILCLMAAGLGNKEVGQRLHITVQTVKNHVHSILQKFKVHRRREAVRRAYDLELLGDASDAPVSGLGDSNRWTN
jgi:DNA-binding NarL/FixJ family response regulator